MPTVSPLADSLRAFVRRVVADISVLPLPPRTYWHYDFTGASPAGETRTVNDPGQFVEVLSGPWIHLPEYQAVGQAIEADGAFRRVVLAKPDGTLFPLRDFALIRFLVRFIKDYLDRVRDVPGYWDETIFSEQFATMTASVAKGALRLNLWAPIFRVDATAVPSGTEVIPGIVIVEPDDLMRDILTERIPPPSFVTIPRYYLRGTAEVSYSSGGPGGSAAEVRNLVPLCVNAIRLAVGGLAKTIGLTALPVPGDCYPAGRAVSWTMSTPAAPIYGSERSSVIRPQDLPSIAEIASLLPRLDPAFNVGLRRFTLTADRLSAEDVLIDATIGLENLLLTDVGEEKTFQFAIRGAWLLAPDDPAKRRQLASQLKRIYRVRSKVVHAHQKADRDLKPDIIENAVEVLRQLLCLVLRQGTSRRAWTEQLDDVVLGSASVT